MKLIALSKYNDENWKKMVSSSFEERRKVMEEICSSAGAKLLDLIYTRGEFDALVVMDVPSEEIGLGMAIAVNASGSVRELKILTEIDIDKALITTRQVSGIYPSG